MSNYKNVMRFIQRISVKLHEQFTCSVNITFAVIKQSWKWHISARQDMEVGVHADLRQRCVQLPQKTCAASRVRV